MNKKGLLFLFAFLLIASFSCRKQRLEKIDDSIIAAGKFPDPPPNSETYSNPVIDSILQGTVYLTCTTETVQVVKRIEDYQTFYVQNSSEIYPGNIIQGKYLKNGSLNSIGEFKRQPISIMLKNATRTKSVDVKDPDRISLTKAVSDNDWYFYFDPPLFTYVDCVKAYSKEQSLLSFNINASWLVGSIDAGLSLTNEVGKTDVFIMLKQIYYNASVGYPRKPSAFFHKSVKPKDLEHIFSTENPPAYINSVSYGRIAIAKVTSNYSKDEIITSLNAKFGVISGGVTAQQTTILENCAYEVVAAGGPAIDTWNIEKLSEYFEGGNTFTNRSGAVPIAYTANYLIDNSPFLTHTVTEYIKRDCY